MGYGITWSKSRDFAIRIIRLYKFLTTEKKEFVLSKQLLRSGTNIGANIREAQNAISKKEFISKMNIALKEAAESEYWLDLLNATGCEFVSIYKDCNELNKLLISIIKSANFKI
jgi:four helix bundle protein